MNLDGFFDFAETLPYRGLTFWACASIVASFIVWGVRRVAGRGNDGH